MRRPKRWFPEVLKDIDKVADAIAWYEEELKTGFEEVDISGSLMGANQRQPGLIAYYDALQADLDALYALMERHHKTMKSLKLRELANAPPTNVRVTATDLKAMAETDPDVAGAEEIAAIVGDLYKQFSALMKALDQRGYALANITKIRIAGMEEVEV